MRLHNVSKKYGETAAVTDLNLTVEAGEFLTLLGPSGSGKTTTLNLIAGFTPLTTGQIYIGATRIDTLPIHERGLGIVFQNYALFPHLTALQNVLFPLKLRKTPKTQRTNLARAALETAGLTGLENRYPHELSGGQRQRVALARALVYQPAVLLLDEPLGALDKQLRERLQLELRRIHKEAGSTFIFVTHDQEEALTLSDRIAVFNSGKLEQVGTAQELYEKPRTLFVANFIGESTTVTENGKSTVVRPENCELHESPATVAPGRPAIPVTVQQSIYLGTGWKHEVVLPDGSTGVARTPTALPWLTHENQPAYLSWQQANAIIF